MTRALRGVPLLGLGLLLLIGTQVELGAAPDAVWEGRPEVQARTYRGAARSACRPAFLRTCLPCSEEGTCPAACLRQDLSPYILIPAVSELAYSQRPA